MNKNSNIGFIGLGNMGNPIFDNLNKNFSNIFCFDKDTSKNIFYLGKSGNGHLMKLLHNSVCHSIFLINCEILNVAKSYGITDTDVIDVFNKSNARSYISESRFPNNILNGKFNGKSSIKNLKKDLKMINLILKNSKSKKRYTELSNEILSKIDNKLDIEDFTNIYKLWDKI